MLNTRIESKKTMVEKCMLEFYKDLHLSRSNYQSKHSNFVNHEYIEFNISMNYSQFIYCYNNIFT